jgi:hypothetical protein
VRSKNHHGDLLIATVLMLWSVVGRPSGRIEAGKLKNCTPDWVAVRAERSYLF